MQDEFLLRQWMVGHDQLSADLDRAIGRIATWGISGGRHQAIGSPYATEVQDAERLLNSAANALLAGFAAIATTAALLTAIFLAIPAADHDASHRAALVFVQAYELA